MGRREWYQEGSSGFVIGSVLVGTLQDGLDLTFVYDE